MRPTLRGLLALFPCALAACVSPGAPDPACSGSSADLDIVDARKLHVRALLRNAGREQRHELVVELRPGRAVAVGLTPMGTQAFRLVHDRNGVHVENRVGRYLGLAPALAYDAVARAYLRAGAPAPERETEVASDACGYTARLVLVDDSPLSEPAPDAPPTP